VPTDGVLSQEYTLMSSESVSGAAAEAAKYRSQGVRDDAEGRSFCGRNVGGSTCGWRVANC
jgi:hypothetical protein